MQRHQQSYLYIKSLSRDRQEFGWTLALMVAGALPFIIGLSLMGN